MDLNRKLRDILTHTEPLPPEAGGPIGLYKRSRNELFSLLQDIEQAFDAAGAVKLEVRDRHLGRLYGMAVVQLVELFEVFLKEAAAVCVDELAAYTLDTRFDKLAVRGSSLAAHLRGGTFGRAACESLTWLDTIGVNTRFKALLASPFEEGRFELFPYGKDKSEERARFGSMDLVWQLRHTIVHNVGVLTKSDAIRFQLLVQMPVATGLLMPVRDDLRHLQQFLDESAERCNKDIGKELSKLLSAIHARDATLFDRQVVADQLTRTFDMVLEVDGATGVLPP